MLAHVSIAARDPEGVARAVAEIMGGAALPFPPCPGAWIAFSDADDGTAVEIYPIGMRVVRGGQTIEFEPHGADEGPVATHVALGSPLPADTILQIGKARGWTSRRCNRGPFDCIEVWLEERVLIEVLDPEMLADYRANMTTENWRSMFGL